MQYTKLGRTGLDVSRVCLGCMSYGEPDSRQPSVDPRGGGEPAVPEEGARSRHQLLRHRQRVFRGSSEEIVGRALLDYARRGEVVIATKVHGRMHKGPNGVRPFEEGHLRARSTPACSASAPTSSTCTRSIAGIRRSPIEETLEALNAVVRAGKALLHRRVVDVRVAVREGAARLRPARLGAVRRRCRTTYNLLYREEEREMLPLCSDEGIGVIPWSPLARGRLARDWDAASARSETDAFGTLALREDGRRRSQGRRGARRRRDAARPPTRAGRAGVGAREAARSRRRSSARRASQQLDDAVAALTLALAPEDIDRARGALRAASDHRPRVTRVGSANVGRPPRGADRVPPPGPASTRMMQSR